MKTLLAILFVCALGTVARAQLLFSDALNYPNGCIETDGVWFCYSPATPALNADITNDALILISGTSEDSVAAPFTNNSGNTLVFASFDINVSKLPSLNGSYFSEFLQDSNGVFDVADVAHVFIDTRNTVVPGTYRLGIANFTNTITAIGATNFPLDLATGITYQVVFSYDPNNSDPLAGATLWINPAQQSDLNVYANDIAATPAQQNIGTNINAIAFSPYADAAVNDVLVGLNFTDVMTNVAELPVIGVEPQPTNTYSGNNVTLYTAASGMDVTYQWLANNTPISDNGTTIIGSTSNILTLNNLQASAGYSVVATTTAGSVTSIVAQVTVNTTPTPPFFTIQPLSQTNSLLSSVTLTALANGTGPITYQWYFEAAGGSSFSPLSGQTSPTLSFTAGYGNSGAYYLTALGGDGNNSSTTANVLVIPPPLETLGYMHNYISNLNSSVTINGGQIFNVEGIVTSIGQVASKTTAEFFIQDATGGCLVYAGGYTPAKTPPVGALVNVISPAQSYYGELEMDPTTTAATNAVIVLSTNNPVPAPVALNLPLMATNTAGTYGNAIQCSLVTLTNVYLYASATGAAVTGNFPTNSTKALYAFQQPYSAGQPYMEVYVYTYTNAANLINTNYFGQPIPSFVYELTGAMGIYNPTTPEVYPTRYADFVSTKAASFSTSISTTNGVPTLGWPAVVGSTYTVYSATNLLGPWTQAFGLGYYPSVGTYTDTNGTPATFYRVSTP
jgi:hypothetical protein